jgi:nitrite reductase/ring-hydroxylating ferredoxin subunit
VSDRTEIAAVEDVPENGGYRFTVSERDGSLEEAFLVRTPEGVEGWKNFCQHETDQRLYRDEVGLVKRGQDVICPKHGSTFDACTGYCDNGEANGSTLVTVAVTVEDGTVYLDDREVEYLYDGGIEGDDDDGDDGPSSSSHLRL